MLFSWACFIFACWRTWQVVYGRMYYLLDSDMSSELVLSHLLRQEHKIVTQDWFYSTELRVFNIHWAFTPLFFLFDNWLKVRQIGTFIVLALIPQPELVFLDELTTGLDAKARRGVWKTLEGLKE